MFRQWMYIGVLLLVGGVPLWAQDDRAIWREREEMVSEQRVALVIGNAKYTNEISLDNPINDANAMATELKKCGFRVLLHKNLKREAMDKAVREFGDEIKSGGVGLFYYSGHGIQVKDKNYLVPVDEDIEAEDEVESKCLDMQLVLNKMHSAGNRVNILILDACRNNNFIKYRSSDSGGLAGIENAPKGTFIAYATSPNKVALDGSGSNSPFTGALVDVMGKKGKKIEDVFKEVRTKVLKDTKNRQTPWEATSLTGEFYFVLPSEDNSFSSSLSPPPRLTDRLPGGEVMEFVWIPPGTFMMGSPSSESVQKDEMPVQEVRISEEFWLSKYEVTRGQWESVMGRDEPWRRKDNVRFGPDYPAVSISWNDVQRFINNLNKSIKSNIYDLPSEAEWEYACRAGTTTHWSFGNEESQLRDYAWYSANAEYAHKVGIKDKNPWGLHDMHGNVWEWVRDWYGSYRRLLLVDPTGPATGSERVIRGDAFDTPGQQVRSAIRHKFSPGSRSGSVGFRLLRRAN